MMNVIWTNWEEASQNSTIDLFGVVDDIVVSVEFGELVDGDWTVKWGDKILDYTSDRRKGKHIIEAHAKAHAFTRNRDKNLRALIRIEETLMLYNGDSVRGMAAIADIVDKALDGNRT